MEWWVGLTVAGAFLQNLRSLLQRRLTRTLSVNGSSYVRFLYALPFAWLFVGFGETVGRPSMAHSGGTLELAV